MPRGERPLDAGDSPLLRFAGDLRSLRRNAGGPSYRELAGRAHYSVAALSDAASGRRLPSLAVTLAYVRACDGDTEEWEHRWHAVAAETAAQTEATIDGASDDEDSPYVGLGAFQSADADRFFGRERAVQDLVARLTQQRFVALFGVSGAGKSSLLRAGLQARLGANGRRVVLFTPGPQPWEECAIVLAAATGAPLTAVRGEIAADRRGLHRVVRQALNGDPPDADLVLVVDQFEEIFTLCHDAEQRAGFIDSLLTAARTANSRCRVVIGVRADFYAHCTAHPGLVDALNVAQVTVGPMTPEELRLAIVQPAARRGCAVETALLAELVAQANGKVGALPLLSHALLETWRRRRGNTLTLAGYQGAGGLDGALGRTAETVYGGLSARQQDSARHLMLRLTALGDGTEDTGRRVSRAELDDDPQTWTVLDRLVHARLVAVDRDSVQITHEALIRAWSRLREWLAEDREGLRLHRKLTEATNTWEALDRDPGTLYRGVRLAHTRQWATRNGGALAAREREFVAASVAAEETEQRLARRRGRRLRLAVAMLSALLVLAAGATSYAISTREAAARQRDAALSRVAASKAAALHRTDPTLAAQLSLAAYRLAPTAEARDELRRAIPLPYAKRLVGHAGNVNSVAVRPDGRGVVTASHDRTARLWDVTDPVRPAAAGVLAGHTDTVNAVAYHPGGALVATASWDGTARLWDVADPRRPLALATLRAHTDDVNAVMFSADGRTVATASTDRTVRLWDVTAPRAPRALATLAGHRGTVVALAFRPDGRTLASAGFDSTVMLWDLVGRARPARLVHPAPVTSVAFSPDGTRLATTGHDGTVRIWRPTDHRPIGELIGHNGIVRSVAFGSDGRTVATAGEDMTVRLWDVSSSAAYRQLAVLDAHSDRVASVAFAADGRLLATGGDDDVAALWRVPETWPGQADMPQIEALVCQMADAPISAADWATHFPGLDYQPPC